MSFGKPSVSQKQKFVEYFELQINWQPDWRFPENAFENMTYSFPKKILGSLISLTYERLMKTLRRT